MQTVPKSSHTEDILMRTKNDISYFYFLCSFPHSFVIHSSYSKYGLDLVVTCSCPWQPRAISHLINIISKQLKVQSIKLSNSIQNLIRYRRIVSVKCFRKIIIRHCVCNWSKVFPRKRNGLVRYSV